MRVQIYQEEMLGQSVELLRQRSRNGEDFYGLRFWLETGPKLAAHSTPEDDDRSAVTFWVRNVSDLDNILAAARLAVRNPGTPVGT